VAVAGLQRLREAVDALIVIPNDRLLNVADRNMSIVQAFRLADDMLRHGVQGIADLVTVPGLINLDFADVRSIMQDAGSALMAIGEGNGPERAAEAAKAAIASPLLEHSIAGATGILLNVTGGPDLTLHEVSEVAELVTEAVSPDANIIFGAVIHPRPEAELRVTLIATGMAENAPQPERGASRGAQSRPLRREAAGFERGAREYERGAGGSPGSAASSREPDAGESARSRLRDEPRLPQAPRSRDTVDLPADADPLDIPPFLRRQR
jgi:cell division protein FtsZ